MYTALAEKLGWAVDTQLQEELKKANEEVGGRCTFGAPFRRVT